MSSTDHLHPRTSPLLLLAVVILATPLMRGQEPARDDEAMTFFETRIRPLLVDRCYGCHGVAEGKNRGGLLLDSWPAIEKGGQSGPAVIRGEVEKSLLIRAVRYQDPELKMPPSGKLKDQEIADLEAWVRRGAPDPRLEGPITKATDGRAATGILYDPEVAKRHWAFQPIAATPPPDVKDADWCRSDIDRFVLARLETEGITPAADADRAVFLRRATFTLTGLPPSPEEMLGFLADTSPQARERAVDRLLASPAYGEHWGRMWLDLARYADSNGVDENLALGHAWRYRDWVVKALNEDLPYDQFLTWQIAGDQVPEPADKEHRYDPLVATGFLMLGPKMLAEQDKEKLVMDVVDEQIDVVMRTAAGLTISCARCHDHKFDPVLAKDYYALAGIFKSTGTMANLDHVSRWRERPLATADEVQRVESWRDAHKKAVDSEKKLREESRAKLQTGWRRDIAAYLVEGTLTTRKTIFVEAEDASRGNLAVDKNHWGTEAEPIARTGDSAVKPQFVEFDLALPRTGRFQLLVRYAAKESRPVRIQWNGATLEGNALGAMTGDWTPEHQRWFEVAVLDALPGRNVLRIERDGVMPHLDKIALAAVEERGTALPGAVAADAATLVPEIVRNVADLLVRSSRDKNPQWRVWNAMAREDGGSFEEVAKARWAELRTQRESGSLGASTLTSALLDGPPPGNLRELAGRYQALFAAASTARERNRKSGKKPDEASLDDPDLDHFAKILHARTGPFAVPEDRVTALLPKVDVDAWAAKKAEIADLDGRRPAELPRALAPEDRKPIDLPVHIRGSHLNLDKTTVPRGVIATLAAVLPNPEIPKDRSGRKDLAAWLCDPRHPLTARVIVNRIWAGHFGKGLVRTPSNFGLRGEVPTHPELLDFLATALVGDGWSLKSLHKRILLSRSWGMDSRPAAGMADTLATRDPENRLLAHQNRRRLSAEGVRDGLLVASGALDRALGGSHLDVGNADYVTNDQSKDRARYALPRRTLYLPVIRNAMADVFTLFDYPDSSVHVEQRSTTVVPGQALWFMNSPFVVEQARRLATSLIEAAPDDEAARLELAWCRCVARPPAGDESSRARAWIDRRRTALVAAPAAGSGTTSEEATLRAWSEYVQVLMASHEFITID